MRNIVLVLVTVLGFLAVGCGETTVVYVYPDAGSPEPLGDAAVPADGSEVLPDAPDASEGLVDAGQPDAQRPAEGTCNPDRVDGTVSHVDCRGLGETPVCDAIMNRCETLPEAACDACETDAQCREGVSLRADCVFIAGDAAFNNDMACLTPCDSQADCDWLGAPYRCMPLPRGSYCVPDWGGTPHCRMSDERGTHRISR